MNSKQIAKSLLLAAFPLVCGSCAQEGESLFLSRSTAAANNHIMLVRRDPPSFGLQRLAALSSHYPDLAVFVSRKGMPNYLAETSKENVRYMILYYLKKREAFACRADSRSSSEVEFSGPYPVTENEVRTLSKLGQSNPR